MTSSPFSKAQFMAPPTYGGVGPVPVGAVKAGSGIEILADGTINATSGGGTVSDIVCTNGIQGGGTTAQVFIGLLPPTDTVIGGVKTIEGSGISIDADGVIRSITDFTLTGGIGIQVDETGTESATVSLKAAGSQTANRGGVYVPNLSGLSVATDGELRLRPATAVVIGGVRPGTGCTVTSDGTLNCSGTGGTITGVGAGTGLGGGGVTGAVSLFLKPPSGTTIGGVYAGPNVNIAADGQISVSQTAGVQTLTVVPQTGINLTGTATNPILACFTADITSFGSVRLSNDINSTLVTGYAASPLAVKTVADLANTKLPLSGGAMTGVIAFTGGQTFPGTVDSGAFTQLGGILVGDTSPPGYAQLPVGANGQVLSANSSAPLGVEWVPAGAGTVTGVLATSPLQSDGSATTPTLSILAASTTQSGAVQLYDGTDSTSATFAATANSVKTAFDLANSALQKSGGTMTGAITFNAGQTFPGTLPLAGGTMTGDITFAGTQTFPGVLAQGSISAAGALDVGGTPANPILSVDTATTTQLGVVQPDGTTITIDGNGVISSAGGMTNPMTTLGDIIYASATGTPGTPERLGVGAAGTILAVNAGLPSWRTSTQLGLLTSAAAASTYAPLDNPTFTGPVNVNAGGSPGSNALIVSGGNLVLATSFTPTSSSSTGSIGELAWDSNYLYFCYAPNTWGRVAVDLTPF